MFLTNLSLNNKLAFYYTKCIAILIKFCLKIAWQQHDVQELCRVMFDALEQKWKQTEQVIHLSQIEGNVF